MLYVFIIFLWIAWFIHDNGYAFDYITNVYVYIHVNNLVKRFFHILNNHMFYVYISSIISYSSVVSFLFIIPCVFLHDGCH